MDSIKGPLPTSWFSSEQEDRFLNFKASCQVRSEGFLPSVFICIYFKTSWRFISLLVDCQHTTKGITDVLYGVANFMFPGQLLSTKTIKYSWNYSCINRLVFWKNAAFLVLVSSYCSWQPINPTLI